MNFLGMGLPEVAVILLVAFLVLGPGKSIDLARSAGKTFRDLRSTFSEVAKSIDLTEEEPPAARRSAPPPTPPDGREEAGRGGQR
ncbi:MAG TPA: twin-arginine translocase TatA/TatE family subunit [Dehalococcoidia bacterium]|nr:twin-arginine translocase TatA/TatE family subunit [Dehalococcoidia bacterium]